MNDENNINNNRKSNNNNNGPGRHQTEPPYIAISSIIFIFGMIFGYMLLDFYIQKKADLSIMQITKMVSVDNSERMAKKKDSDEKKVYSIYLNDVEHNFSFKNFRVEDLKIDSMSIEYLKIKKDKKYE